MNKFSELKLVTITRRDISEGYQVCQSLHSLADFAFEFPEDFKKWKLESNSIISLSIKNEYELKDLYQKLKDISPSVIFFEPDIDQHTSICVYGTPEVRKMLAKFPLALKNKK